MSLLDKFHQLKIENGEKMLTYITGVENLVKEIKDTGEDVSDTSVFTKIISALPMKYRYFRQAWLSMEPDRRTLKNLSTRLLDKEVNLSLSEDLDSAITVEQKPCPSNHQNVQCYT